MPDSLITRESRRPGGLPVAVVDLSMSYTRRRGQTRVLKGIDLEVPAGQFLCVLGPSGSGKSTLLHLLAGLEHPTQGEIRIGETQLGRLSEDETARWRRRNVGLVHQFFNLIPSLSVIQNIALPLMLDGRRICDVKDDILALLERLQIAHRVDHALDELSGGELQRVAIARALLPDPGLILADEPTGNLDSTAGNEVLALFRELSSERGATTILMTHDHDAINYSDRVVLLRNGQIEQDEGSQSAHPA